MIFVSVLVLVDMIFLTFYTLLEGLLDKFGVLQVPNKESLSSVSGVRDGISGVATNHTFHCFNCSVGVGNNHALLHLSMLNKAMDKNFISGSAVWLQVCASDFCPLSCLSNP